MKMCTDIHSGMNSSDCSATSRKTFVVLREMSQNEWMNCHEFWYKCPPQDGLITLVTQAIIRSKMLFVQCLGLNPSTCKTNTVAISLSCVYEMLACQHCYCEYNNMLMLEFSSKRCCANKYSTVFFQSDLQHLIMSLSVM